MLFFQALITMVCSVGFEKTFCDLLPKYPGLIFIPIFSCFSFGSIDVKSSCCDLTCQNGQRSLGVSFCLTWLNMCTTICVPLCVLLITSYNSITGDDWGFGYLFFLVAVGKIIFRI